MKVYEIALPTVHANGRPCEGLHFTFQSVALQEAGGFTVRPDGDGAWRDTRTMVTHYDRMRPYRVMCDESTLNRLVTTAFQIWKDEVAIMITEIGEGFIVRRHESLEGIQYESVKPQLAIINNFPG